MSRALSHPLRILAFLSIALMLVACHPQPSLYQANPVPVPLLKNAGEARISATADGGVNLSGGGDNTGTYQFAYALTNDLGIIAAFTYAAKGGNNSIYSSLGYGEAGFGYHELVGQSWGFEAYGGMGYGSVANAWSENYTPIDGFLSPVPFQRLTYSKMDMSYVRPFMQVSMGMEGNVAALALSARLAWLHAMHVNEDVLNMNQAGSDLLSGTPLFDTSETLTTRKIDQLFFEPAITFRLGYKHIKFYCEMTLSEAVGSKPWFAWSEVLLSGGLSLEF